MRYRAEIDGLRALAVIPVILFHAGFSFFSGGFIGVDVFFVISGYLITTILINELDTGSFSIIKFYERRARRILPALFLVMLCLLPFAWFWLPPPDHKNFSLSLVAVPVFASNVLFWLSSGYFETTAELKPLLHTWSLAVEEQYYLFFPLLLMFTWRWGKAWVLALLTVIAALSLAAAQWGSQALPDATFYLLPSRAWELFIGSFVAFYFSSNGDRLPSRLISESGSAAGFLLIAGSIFIFNKSTPFPSLFTLAPTVGAALIIVFASPSNTVGKLLRSKIFVDVGLISYSAYLWHQPMFAFAKHRSIDEPGPVLMAALTAASLLLAYGSWKFVEAPFRDRKKFNRTQIFSIGAVGSVVFISMGLAGHFGQGFPSRLNPKTAELAGTNMHIFESQVKDCWQRFDQRPNVDAACVLGASDKPPTFALLGDSHAGTLLHELNERAKQLHIAGLNYTYIACPPIKNATHIPLYESYIQCAALSKSFFDGLNHNPHIPQTIIVQARWALLMERTRFMNGEGGNEAGSEFVMDIPLGEKAYADAMKDKFKESINAILSTGRRVILIYPNPEVGWQVPDRLAKLHKFHGRLEPSDGSTTFKRYMERNERAIEALDALGDQPNLIRIRPASLFCNTFVKDRCAVHANGASLYFDGDHLSNLGSRMVIQEIEKQLLQ